MAKVENFLNSSLRISQKKRNITQVAFSKKVPMLNTVIVAKAILKDREWKIFGCGQDYK